MKPILVSPKIADRAVAAAWASYDPPAMSDTQMMAHFIRNAIGGRGRACVYLPGDFA